MLLEYREIFKKRAVPNEEEESRRKEASSLLESSISATSSHWIIRYKEWMRDGAGISW